MVPNHANITVCTKLAQIRKRNKYKKYEKNKTLTIKLNLSTKRFKNIANAPNNDDCCKLKLCTRQRND